ncbi:hypothetical protein EV368DRAFT_67810 [Lentinula lateritia]|nr:hypothetical protein EV368DRAFT_67810 [Lentinula lateritia]
MACSNRYMLSCLMIGMGNRFPSNSSGISGSQGGSNGNITAHVPPLQTLPESLRVVISQKQLKALQSTSQQQKHPEQALIFALGAFVAGERSPVWYKMIEGHCTAVHVHGIHSASGTMQ